MKYKILVTAIGSFSADCVIRELNKAGHTVIGCDIFPSAWHAVSHDCERVYQSPLAVDHDKYIAFVMEICANEGITHVFPLTDVEIDTLNMHRAVIEDTGVVLCMPSNESLSIARDKYRLHQAFVDDEQVPSIETHKLSEVDIATMIPCIVKPYNGRSSEGLRRVSKACEVEDITNKADFIAQRLITGPVFTVDYARCDRTGHDFMIPREELLRTKNGAGTTVRITPDEGLVRLVSHIGQKLKINGVINMEFIKHDDAYHLIDINPRFSAGVAFTVKAGYNMVLSHLNCFTGADILPPCEYQECLMTKRYVEEIIYNT